MALYEHFIVILVEMQEHARQSEAEHARQSEADHPRQSKAEHARQSEAPFQCRI